MELKGKRVLITGGGTGIGRGVALALAAEGCRVAIAGRREEKLHEAASSWDGEPAILFHTADVADRESVQTLSAWVSEKLGGVDILVNSAGVNVKRRTMAELDPADWNKIVGVTASGAFHCMQAVLPQMRERKDGLIINIISTAGKRASLLGGVAYSAGKFAMSALGTTVGLEEAKNGIRITNLYPGEVNTPLLDSRPVASSDEQKARMLQPEDVAAAVVMIAQLPPRANVAEILIKPTVQEYA